MCCFCGPRSFYGRCHPCTCKKDIKQTFKPEICHHDDIIMQMETFIVSLAICEGNSPVTSEFPSQRPVEWGFGVFFHRRLNKSLSNQSRRLWFETPSGPLCRHCNVGEDRGVWTPYPQGSAPPLFFSTIFFSATVTGPGGGFVALPGAGPSKKTQLKISSWKNSNHCVQAN